MRKVRKRRANNADLRPNFFSFDIFSVSRAQTATEYMVILAVVIIISLIVVVVMSDIPTIGKETKNRAKDTFWNTASIGVVSYYNSVDSGSKLIIKNNNPFTIRLIWLNSSTTMDDSNPASFNSTAFVIGSGEVKVLMGELTPSCDNIGDSWQSYLFFKYQNIENQAIYYYKGEGNSLEGVCAS